MNMTTVIHITSYKTCEIGGRIASLILFDKHVLISRWQSDPYTSGWRFSGEKVTQGKPIGLWRSLCRDHTFLLSCEKTHLICEGKLGWFHFAGCLDSWQWWKPGHFLGEKHTVLEYRQHLKLLAYKAAQIRHERDKE